MYLFSLYSGTLPAEVDPETGRDINPHIPSYIAQAPWYLDITHPTLKHQRVKEKGANRFDEWYARGVKAGSAATKFRKGACENCGALTHKTRDCLERPRKLGAKWSGKDIAQDEVIQNVDLGFEAKRDRWNGYEPAEHMRHIAEWELIDAARKKFREQEAARKMKEGGGEDDAVGDSSDEDDEDKYAEATDMPGQKVDQKTRTTVRNLRIREDKAKYLLNLDVNSAYYDPKTRSMRDNPIQHADPHDLAYAGDNFVKYTGDAPKMAELQRFAWSAADRGADVHLQANPTQGELAYQEFLKTKEKFSESQRNSILEKYGGSEHLAAPPKELLLSQTEAYVEYSQTGKVIKGLEKAPLKSKYEEDK